MKYSVLCETLSHLDEALTSKCDGIRFGVEFCEWKIPSLAVIKKVYEKVEDAGKPFTYVSPLLSNVGMDRIRKHLDYLNKFEDVEIVIGDLGILNLITDYKMLHFRLGRPRVYLPGRSPWDQITRMPNPSFFAKRKVDKIFYQTNLNYKRSLEYFDSLGIVGADVDWISKSFPYYKQIIRNGFNLAIHTYAVPIAVTMRCHTARFLGEEKPTLCTKPCLDRTFTIHQNELNKDFILNGNVVFRLVESNKKEVRDIERIGIKEIIIPIGSMTPVKTTYDINNSITALSGGA